MRVRGREAQGVLEVLSSLRFAPCPSSMSCGRAGQPLPQRSAANRIIQRRRAVAPSQNRFDSISTEVATTCLPAPIQMLGYQRGWKTLQTPTALTAKEELNRLRTNTKDKILSIIPICVILEAQLNKCVWIFI